ncbi:MAG: DUF4364 family protein [Clostridia bacterium]|jgi:hypothetical protein|nr:DUF4364 family protein [Clostridia bacterium]MBQ1375095.1 DUF4364 family protein [Clostridia bacterium]MBQ1434379.1 DUF4364 family protein [Clostridia bacterium]MBQ4249650.1 DUF4364 family protein [Clostridia bacterium]
MPFGVITDITEAKLLILYIFKYCGTALPKTALDDIVKTDELIDHFAYSEAFAQLLKSGHIYKVPDRDVYSIDADGEEAISLLTKNIPFSIRERAIKESTVVLARMREAEHIVGEYYPNDDEAGSYTAVLKIIGESDTLFDLKLWLPNRMQSDIITTNFKKDPIGVFKEFLKLVSN